MLHPKTHYYMLKMYTFSISHVSMYICDVSNHFMKASFLVSNTCTTTDPGCGWEWGGGSVYPLCRFQVKWGRCASGMASVVTPNETAITGLIKSTDAFDHQGAGGKLCCPH